MALNGRRLVAILLVSWGVGAAACRRTTLCEQGSCAQRSTGSGGNPAGGGSPEGGENASEPAASGAAGYAADAGAAGEGGLAGLMCPDGFADCDGSKFTGCETNLDWNHRNCGACGHGCEGGCRDQTCLETLRLPDDTLISSMVRTKALAFGIVNTVPTLLVKIDIADGELRELARIPASAAELCSGSDRVYVWDKQHDESASGLWSMLPDGTNLEPELLEDATSFGASGKGAYYVSTLEDSDGVSVDQLWFRPAAGASWEVLSQGTTKTEILACSSFGVALSQLDSDDQAQLYLLDGRDVVHYGPAPTGLVEVAVTERGITVLGSDAQLWWLRAASEPKHYPLSGQPANQYRKLHVFYDEVALYFEERDAAFVQQFDEDGPLRGRIGLARASELVFVDMNYVWHWNFDTWVTSRFFRSTWFDIGL
jgi:hypothetical protein